VRVETQFQEENVPSWFGRIFFLFSQNRKSGFHTDDGLTDAFFNYSTAKEAIQNERKAPAHSLTIVCVLRYVRYDHQSAAATKATH
jgi:hypothetical protein